MTNPRSLEDIPFSIPPVRDIRALLPNDPRAKDAPDYRMSRPWIDWLTGLGDKVQNIEYQLTIITNMLGSAVGDTGTGAGGGGSSEDMMIPGPKGDRGLAGALGLLFGEDFTGPEGERGPPGPASVNSNLINTIFNLIPLEDGIVGDDGPPGSRGVDGTAGAQGIQGVIGPPGFMCEDGLEGDSGPPGPRGADGIAGTVGATGPAGVNGTQFISDDGDSDTDLFVPGPKGEAGTPARNDAVAAHFAGDYEDRDTPLVIPVFQPIFATWTPTLFNTTNVAASTAYLCHYMRVGELVICFGRVDIDPTSASVATLLGMSIPIPSNFSTVHQAGGVGHAIGAVSLGGPVIADIANDRVSFSYVTTSVVTNQGWGFIFAYRILA